MRYGALLLVALALVTASCGNDPTPTALPTASPTPTLPLVSALADVTLRVGPGFDYVEAAQVAKDTSLALLGVARGRDCEEWALVRTAAGEEGWVKPVLVNVDVGKSTLNVAATPTPSTPLVPTPAACSDELALVQIDNNLGVTLELFMSGAEPGLTLTIDSGTARLICLTPGDYCYDLTDGNEHEIGSLFFVGGQCTCWHWGGASPQAGSCQCPQEPGSYQRP